MVRGLDHVVWPTRDLDGLAETFRRLGFTVGRRNRHPWGTLNHIVQFDGCFLELLGFAADYRRLPDDDPAFPFAGFCETFLVGSHGGAAMLVLRSQDAAADATTFAALGIGHGRTLPFSRAAQGPDGSDRTVSFTVAFADLPGLPEIGAFVCQQHRPENFWNPAAQRHPNGANGIAGVTLATPDPAACTPGLRAFAGDDLATSHGGVAVRLGNGTIEVVPSRRDVSDEPVTASRLTSVRITVVDLPRVAHRLRDAGIAHTSGIDRLTVGAPEIGGTDLVFCTGNRG